MVDFETKEYVWGNELIGFHLPIGWFELRSTDEHAEAYHHFCSTECLTVHVTELVGASSPALQAALTE